MAVSNTAQLQLEQLVSQSGCLDPVITLDDKCDLSLDNSLKARLLENVRVTGSAKNNAQIAQELLPLATGWQLMPSVLERETCAGTSIAVVAGLAFALEPKIYKLLDSIDLDYSGGHYVLRSGDKVWQSLGAFIDTRVGSAT